MLVGTWKLKSVAFTESEKTELYEDIKGLLIFSADGYYSLGLKLNANPAKAYNKSLIPNYYSAGEYSVNGDVLTEKNQIHALDSRMGEKREVKIILDDKTLVQTFNFGPEAQLKMVWEK